MSVQNAQQRLRDAALDTSIGQGKIILNNLYPQEFEYYMMAFELEGDEGISDRFIFPVMPNNITISDSKNTTIRRTNSGTTILTDNSFTPKMISISGNFGRSLKLMFGNIEEKSGKLTSPGSRPEFDPNVKTGYGLIKRLERLYHKSTELAGQIGKNNNRPYRVYFYNLSFDQRFLVEILEFKAIQSMDSNMIWNYNMTMRAVSPLDGLVSFSRVSGFTEISYIGSKVTSMARGLNNVISYDKVLSSVYNQ